eukprot:TRINITY_DN11943_c0_g1_i1.p1 TRINITY_DN11943_c0_g1~~TRINITY_DN11943_c0_g1_i1.p1  ORF type:complete len:383 (+),score=98.92 TRINITY_DN11943_c0_g1_i1:89-1150(+)
MENLPITINDHKLGEWLHDRECDFTKKHGPQYTELTGLAPKITRLVKYEIPGLKEVIAKCMKIEAEVERKEAELEKTAKSHEESIRAWDESFGTDEKTARSRAKEKQEVLEREIHEAARQCQPAIIYYKDFTRTTNPNTVVELRHLTALISEDPRPVPPPSCSISSRGAESIDWGDFGLEDEGHEEQEEKEEEAHLSEHHIVLEPATEEQMTKDGVLDDLTELMTFYQFVDPTQEHLSLPPFCAGGREAVSNLIGLLTSPEYVHLDMLQREEPYLHRLLAEVRQKKHLAAQTRARIRKNTERLDRALQDLAAAQQQLATSREQARACKEEVQTTLGRWYKPRKVYLVGDIENI